MSQSSDTTDDYPSHDVATLRDMFAAHALTGLMVHRPMSGVGGAAIDAYRMADAMLEARKAVKP